MTNYASADGPATRTDSPVAEKSSESNASRLNWLRAGVLGANDGIVSIAALVVGVAGATQSTAGQ